jgi:hypothetical protein
MKKIIQHIRKQPEHVKTRYVVIFSLVATGGILVVWLLTLQVTQVPREDIIRTESPFSFFGKIFSQPINKIRNSYPLMQGQEATDQSSWTPEQVVPDESFAL